jgi:hypothetical protein
MQELIGSKDDISRPAMTDLATLTAILYAARLQRRVPESDAEKRRAIADALADAKLILAAVVEDTRSATATPKQPPPSPGAIGRIADAKATRRRGQSGVRPATEA